MEVGVAGMKAIDVARLAKAAFDDDDYAAELAAHVMRRDVT